MIRLSVFLALFCALAPAQILRVSPGGRHLQHSDGRPFLYLGDTAWELFHRLNREEADLYLRNRAAKGFTVIQAVALAERDGLTVPNPYGHLPLVDRDPARPVEGYFEHVDYIVNRAAELGLTVGMLPTWGSYWTTGNKNAVFTAENARFFGRFLGARYKEKPIIWILGGDQNIRTPAERAIIDAMAEGLAEGDGGRHLKTFHPRGPGMSSLQLRDAKWLDFHMSQTSHGARDHDTGLYIEHDRALNPPKPTLDGEPRYEMIPVGFYFANYSRLERMDDFDARTAAYWAMLAGAAGHTYGHNSVWQMWKPGLPSAINADIPWMQAIDHPGAFQMGHLRRLLESRPWQTLIPDQSIIRSGPATGPATVRAARAADGRFAFIYTPRGEQFTLDRGIIKAERVKEIWWDPRYGVAHHIHTGDNQAFQTYTPPTSGRGQDWLLILEDEAAKFPLPVP
ncbi:MAG: DUF4038 domain-containing protein [Bryobacteraceae bacterium]|nr:DUF4038 domain-containing protein [Bryobacteraceae bacterium]